MTPSTHQDRFPVDVIIVGPTHPHTGGVAQHTTRLAHELIAAGHVVSVESWKAQYPKNSRNGLGLVPRDQPELPLLPNVVEKLAWYSPFSWISLLGRVSRARLTVFTVVAPPHAVMFAIPLIALPKKRRAAIIHNVLPHEPSRFDRPLMRWFLRRMSLVIVHSDEQRDLALSLGASEGAVRVTPLPSPGFAMDRDELAVPPFLKDNGPLRLLFFGMVRHYKGLDVLLHAMSLTRNATLKIAGHFWEPRQKYDALIESLGLTERVETSAGYVEAQEVSRLLSESDVLVLPYRSATASIVADIGVSNGRPVIVTRVGTLSETVHRTGAGIVVEPDDPRALADAIDHLSNRSHFEAIVEKVRVAPDPNLARWGAYVEVVEAGIPHER